MFFKDLDGFFKKFIGTCSRINRPIKLAFLNICIKSQIIEDFLEYLFKNQWIYKLIYLKHFQGHADLDLF